METPAPASLPRDRIDRRNAVTLKLLAIAGLVRLLQVKVTEGAVPAQ